MFRTPSRAASASMPACPTGSTSASSPSPPWGTVTSRHLRSARALRKWRDVTVPHGGEGDEAEVDPVGQAGIDADAAREGVRNMLGDCRVDDGPDEADQQVENDGAEHAVADGVSRSEHIDAHGNGENQKAARRGNVAYDRKQR